MADSIYILPNELFLSILSFDVTIISVDISTSASFNFSPNSNMTTLCKMFQVVKADAAEMMALWVTTSCQIRSTCNLSNDLRSYFLGQINVFHMDDEMYRLQRCLATSYKIDTIPFPNPIAIKFENFHFSETSKKTYHSACCVNLEDHHVGMKKVLISIPKFPTAITGLFLLGACPEMSEGSTTFCTQTPCAG